MGREAGEPIAAAYSCIICHTTFSLMPSPHIRSPRLTDRNTRPSVTSAADVQTSIATFTQPGIGTVRTRACLPTRSTMHQRPSRCWMCVSVSAATSDRRNPQPRRTARMARSRNPLTVSMSGCAEQRLRLLQREPIANSDTLRFHALHAGDASRHLWREQPVVRSPRSPACGSPTSG